MVCSMSAVISAVKPIHQFIRRTIIERADNCDFTHMLSALRLSVWLFDNRHIQLLYMDYRFLFTLGTK